VAIVAAWHVPSTCRQCTEMTEGWWGIRGRGVSWPRQRSKYPGRRAGTIRIQGYTRVQFYAFIRVWTLKSKRVNTGKNDKGRRIERIKREMTNKIARFKVLTEVKRWSDVFSVLACYALSTGVQLRTFRTIVVSHTKGWRLFTGHWHLIFREF